MQKHSFCSVLLLSRAEQRGVSRVWMTGGGRPILWMTMSSVQAPAAKARPGGRTALVLELAPLAAGMALVILFVALDFFVGPVDSDGLWGWQSLDALVGFIILPWALAIVGALALFMVSGVGWLIAGRTAIGFLILFWRGWVSLGVLSFDPSQGGLSPALMSFIASMAMAAGSVLALAFVTRPGRDAP